MFSWLFFWRKSVDQILASFNKTISQLDRMHEQCAFKADLLARRAETYANESERAHNVSEKLRKLIA